MKHVIPRQEEASLISAQYWKRKNKIECFSGAGLKNLHTIISQINNDTATNILTSKLGIIQDNIFSCQ